MPRFTLKTLFLAILVASIGMAMLVYLFKNYPMLPPGGQVMVWFASGAVIGVAIFMPFKRPFWGALCGVIVQWIIMSMTGVRGMFPPKYFR